MYFEFLPPVSEELSVLAPKRMKKLQVRSNEVVMNGEDGYCSEDLASDAKDGAMAMNPGGSGMMDSPLTVLSVDSQQKKTSLHKTCRAIIYPYSQLAVHLCFF